MAISNTTIQIRKSGITGNVPASLNFGELALNYYDGKLYYKNNTGNISYFYGANNGPSFATANANSSLIFATLPNDTLSFVGANGVTVTGNTTSKTITIGDGATYNLAAAAFAAANAAAGGITSSQYVTRGTLTSNQSLNNGTDTTIVFNTASFDPQGWLNTGTGAFKPTIAGYYSIKYVVWFTQGTAGSGSQYNIQIHKNTLSGGTTAITQQTISGNNGQTLVATDTVYLNGTTDYVAFSAYSSVAGQSAQASGGQGTYFIAELDAVSSLANSTLVYANSAYTSANLAYAAANSATVYTNSAFTAANSAGSYANGAFIQANSAFSVSNSAASYANSGFAVANSASVYANGAFVQANSAFAVSNSASVYANGAFVQANSGFAVANSASLYANGAFIQANSAFIKANTPWSYLSNGSYTLLVQSDGQLVLPQTTLAGYITGSFTSTSNVSINAGGNIWRFDSLGNLNGPYGVNLTTAGIRYNDGTYQNTAAATLAYSQSGYAQANAAFAVANSSSSYANGAFVQANSAFAVSNSASIYANGAFIQANSAFGISNSAASYANGAFIQANAAFIRSNNSLNANTGGTVSGTIIVNTGSAQSINTTGPVYVGSDLSVTGNIYLSGSATQYQANVLSVQDPMIYLAGNNSADLVDIGFYGHFVGTGSSGFSHYQHTGFIRDYSDRKWKLFSNVPEPSVSNSYIDLTYAIYDTIKVGTIEAASSNINGYDVVAYTNSAFAAANSAGSYANAAFAVANTDVTGVTITAGTYGGASQIPVIVAAANGRITAISNTTIYVPPGTAIFANSGQLTANSSTGNVAIGLANTGITAGVYGNTSTIPSFTIDSFGRITSVSNNSVTATTVATIVNNVDTFTANGTGQTFTLSVVPYNLNSTIVNINGATQQKSSYTLSGNTVTLSEIVPNGTVIEVTTLLNGANTNAAVPALVPYDDNFVGNGSTTAYTLSASPVNSNYTSVFVSGVAQQKSTYTITGNIITFSTAPPNGSSIEVVTYAANTGVLIGLNQGTQVANSLIYYGGSTYNSYTNSTIYANGTIGFSNQFIVSNTTPSTSNTTGALLVSGGLGVAGNIYATSVSFVSANAQNSSVVSYSSSNIYDFDDLSYATDGFKNTFSLTYNQQSIPIPSPFNLMVTVNGLIQPAFDYKYDTVWLSYILSASKGYTLDNSGNLRFADAPPPNSQILVRTVAGSVPPTNKKVYPFKPLDIVMGY